MEHHDTSYRLHRIGGLAVAFHGSDDDETGTPYYYGMLSAEGYFLIIERTETEGQVATTRYYRGKGGLSAYQTAWTNRATLTYLYYVEMF